jgi:uncharacterized membrane protein
MDLDSLRIVIAVCLVVVSISFAWVLITLQGLLSEGLKNMKKVTKLTTELEQNIIAPLRSVGGALSSVSRFFRKRKKGGGKDEKGK